MQGRDLVFWVWLSEALGAASRCYRPLTEVYGNAYDVFMASPSELERVPNLTERVVRALSDKRLDRAEAIVRTCEERGISILSWADEAYPSALREIGEPPVLLYCLGEMPDLDRALCVGVVGTRRMSEYGMRAAYTLAYELASAGTVIVSGMAAGIDGVSAAAAIAANGKTVAVLGCGLNFVYPKHHNLLMKEIGQHGAVISEYAPDVPPSSYHFPVRNRLISGISQGPVVVEAGLGSGSLITARDAIMQGKEVFAVPANIGSENAAGTNGLLRDGATVAQSAEDILRPFQFLYGAVLRPERLTAAKQRSAPDRAYLQRLRVIEPDAPVLPNDPTEARPIPPPKREERQTVSDRLKPKKKPTAERPPHETPPPAPKREPKPTPAGLTPEQIAVLGAMPDDQPIAGDLLTKLDIPYGKIVATLTVLEIMGLIRKLPGAMYQKI